MLQKVDTVLPIKYKAESFNEGEKANGLHGRVWR